MKTILALLAIAVSTAAFPQTLPVVDIHTEFPMTDVQAMPPSVPGRFAVRGSLYPQPSYFHFVNETLWRHVDRLSFGIDAALHSHLATVVRGDIVILTNDQSTGHGPEASAFAMARITSVAIEGPTAHVNVEPFTVHPVFYLDVDGDGQGNGYSPVRAKVGFVRVGPR